MYILGLSLSFLSFSPTFTLNFAYLSPIVNFTVTVIPPSPVNFSVVYLPITHVRLPYILTHLLSTTDQRRRPITDASFTHALRSIIGIGLGIGIVLAIAIRSKQEAHTARDLVKALLDRYRYLSRPFRISSSDLPN